MNKLIAILAAALLLTNWSLFSQTTLTHNVGNTVIPNSMYSCSSGSICWARKFILSDFGIGANQNFTINTGEVGLFHGVNWDVNLKFNIYAIDSNFPASFSESSLIGSSQVVGIPMDPNINQIITVNFTNPVIVPAGTSTILVEVFQLNSTNSEAHAFVAGTATDNDFSWFRSKNPGCPPYNLYTTTVDLGRPDARFYITVNGIASTLSNHAFNSLSEILVFPNPIFEEFFIKNIDIDSKIEMFNSLGQKIEFIRTTISSNEIKIKLNKTNSGLYYLKMGNGITKKIVVN